MQSILCLSLYLFSEFFSRQDFFNGIRSIRLQGTYRMYKIKSQSHHNYRDNIITDKHSHLQHYYPYVARREKEKLNHNLQKNKKRNYCRVIDLTLLA